MSWKESLKYRINRLRRRLLYSYRAETLRYIRRLNRLGAKIDESVSMSVPESVRLDETTPWMLEIGKNVYIAEGVKIMTHDASWMVLAGEDGIDRGHIAPVSIGDNVFLGIDSIVMCNVKICDNVIVGAGAVVTSSIRTPGVYAGNPARKVMDLEQMKAVRDSRQLKEALVLAREYQKKYGKFPPREVFDEYFWLFEEKDLSGLPECFRRQMTHSGNRKKMEEAFLASEPEFAGYDAFRKWCEERICRE